MVLGLEKFSSASLGFERHIVECLDRDCEFLLFPESSKALQ
jgi:hypothetical protein